MRFVDKIVLCEINSEQAENNLEKWEKYSRKV